MSATLDHGGVDKALADIAATFGSPEDQAATTAPENADIHFGYKGWSSKIINDKGNPVGGWIVDVVILDEGESAVVTIESNGRKGPRPWRTRTIPLSQLLWPLDAQTTSQIIATARCLAGWIRDLGKTNDLAADLELMRYVGNLYEAARS